MNSKDPIRLFLRDELHEAVRVEIGLGSGVCKEREFADVVLDAIGLQFLLGLTNPSNLWMGVDDGRDGCVVDVSMASLEVLDSRDALLFCFVGQHRAKCRVTDAFDVWRRGVELTVHDDAVLLVELDTGGLQVQPLSIGSTSHSDQDNVGFDLCGVMIQVQRAQ